MIHTMKATIDSAGRVVIPRDVRREARLEPGTPLDVRWRNGLIEIEPEPLPVRLVRKGRLLIAVPRSAVGTLRADDVEATRRALRRQRSPRS